jgi:hypothetical protein
METYENSTGRSGVISFEITADSISVYFKGGNVYLYNSTKPGTNHVNRMKDLAQSGSGLNSYIKKYIGSNCFRIR